MKELSKDNHLYLTSITRKMNKEDAERLAENIGAGFQGQPVVL